jgi:hypothetical protein
MSPALQAGVVRSVQAGEHGDLVAAQSRNASTAVGGQSDLVRGDPRPSGGQEFAVLALGVADADTVQVAADELKERGFALLHEARTEPWGQTVARLQSSESAIIGLSYVPSMHS